MDVWKASRLVGDAIMTRSLPLADEIPEVVREALDYEAPFVIEKLLRDRAVETAEEALELFTEVKRYLVLNHVDPSKSWQMYSLRVDEAWHQFVLFTAEYVAFCNEYFGYYLHHAPSNAPDPGFGDTPPEATFEEFATRYREMFGVDLPDVWDDACGVTPNRRVLNDRAGELGMESRDGMIDLIGPRGRILFSVSEIAQEAMRFIARTGAFYVRELPGDLTDEEKVGLISTLVDMKLLRVG